MIDLLLDLFVYLWNGFWPIWLFLLGVLVYDIVSRGLCPKRPYRSQLRPRRPRRITCQRRKYESQ